MSRPLDLVAAPLARLDARRDGSEFFVFNRCGWRKALELSGFAVEASSGTIRDRPGPSYSGDRSLTAGRLMHALAIRGRSIGLRAGGLRA